MEFTLTFIELFFSLVYYLAPLLAFLFLLIVTAGLAVGRIEKLSILDSIYYALITATTVGYGDIRPQQKVSKLIAVCIALVGLVTTGIIVTVGVLATQETFDRHYDREAIREIIEAQ